VVLSNYKQLPSIVGSWDIVGLTFAKQCEQFQAVGSGRAGAGENSCKQLRMIMSG